MLPFTLFAAGRDSAVNTWLRENPLVLSAIFTILGLALIYFGVTGLIKGSTTGKYGKKHSGGTAKFISILRLILGVGLIGVSLYVAIFGAW